MIVDRAMRWLIQKAYPAGLQSVTSGRWYNWWGPVRESYPGAWQQNVTIDPPQTILTNSSVFHCVTGIAKDVSKMRIKLIESTNGIDKEITDPLVPFLAVLKKPNHYQNRIQFLQQWLISVLLQGNTYVLKQRDRRGIVTDMYVLSPLRVIPLEAPNGDIYYQLSPDPLSGLPETVTVPASEIIHDRINPLWHPLVGISPLYACALSATLTGKIQGNSINFFGNASRPSFVLIAPGPIDQANADLLKSNFETKFSGINAGKVAVLGDGMKLETVQMSAEASQLAEQLGLTIHDVARAFHYPHWKLTGEMPAYASNPEVLTLEYYTECLHDYIENIELSLDEGLGLVDAGYGSELDTDNLWRMDTRTLYETINSAKNWMTTNEQRFRANLPPIEGGDEVFKQQQDVPLSVAATMQQAQLTTPKPAQPAQIPQSTEAAMHLPVMKFLPLEDDPEMLNALFEVELSKAVRA